MITGLVILVVTISQGPLKLPLQLRWRRGPNMPFEMDYYVQSVLVQGTLYVGGGESRGNNKYIVMAYDISGGKWAKLPPYSAPYFAMTVINSQLVLIGGGSYGGRKSKVLGVWSAGSKKWTHPYPDMLTACYLCSAAVYNEWLVVAGGWGDGSVRLSSVQVMNTDTKQWYTAPPTPVPCMESNEDSYCG